MRENFSKTTIQNLATRSGHRCSFPGCHRSTSGPSNEAADKTAISGEAAHICAASKGKGARRRMLDSSYDPKKIRAYENGVWMCGTHAKIIDTDEVTYTVEMLNAWRCLAELRADLAHKTGKEIPVFLREGNKIPLAKVSRKVIKSETQDLHDCVSVICNAIINSCITDIWGDDLGIAVRDFAGELLQNEFTYGEGNEFILEIFEHKLSLKGNGKEFSFQSLVNSQNGQGGQIAASHLKNQDSSLLVSYRREENWNVTDIAFICDPDEVLTATSCSVSGEDLLADSIFQQGYPASEICAFEHCETIYVAIPNSMIFIPSVSIAVAKKLHALRNRNIVLIGKSISKSVSDYFSENFSNIRIMRI